MTEAIFAVQLSLEEPSDSLGEGIREKKGVIYTRDWVVNLILDLAGYREESDLVSALAVEPAAGNGAFLLPMVRRLVESCRRRRLPFSAMTMSLLAYELDRDSAQAARLAIVTVLREAGATAEVAHELAAGWVQTGNYLLEWPKAPPADFVIGNPPYVRLEDVPEPITTAYRGMYRTMVGRADIYVAFFEAGLKHLKPGGVCGFICADRWMLNQYGTELRRLVTADFSVETIIEMHRVDAFYTEVSAYPAVTVIRRATQNAVLVAAAATDAGAHAMPGLAAALHAAAASAGASAPPLGFRVARVDEWFHGDQPWPCTSPERLLLLKKLESDFGPLEDRDTNTQVTIGVATGSDKVFVTRDVDLVESERLLPLAMAFDTADGKLRWSGHYLVNPWDERGGLVDLASFPRLRAYFESHRTTLAGRHTALRNPRAWYRTIDRVNHQLVNQPKLYLPDIKGAIHPVLDLGTTYPHHNLYVVHSTGWDIEVLGGLLLSAVAQFFIECYAVRMRGGWLRFQAQYLRRIRVPHPSTLPESLARALRAAFRERDLQLANAAAFELYGISGIPEEHAVEP